MATELKELIAAEKFQSEINAMRRELPQGDWNWPGSATVCANLQRAAIKMAMARYAHSSYAHLHLMAVLGCGNEETCKAEQLHMRQLGYL